MYSRVCLMDSLADPTNLDTLRLLVNLVNEFRNVEPHATPKQKAEVHRNAKTQLPL